jgi:hypothetical protein
VTECVREVGEVCGWSASRELAALQVGNEQCLADVGLLPLAAKVNKHARVSVTSIVTAHYPYHFIVVALHAGVGLSLDKN